jgi:hypothetical protein
MKTLSFAAEVRKSGILPRMAGNSNSGKHLYKHGMSSWPEYRTWKAMKDRCYRTSHVAFGRYGGVGIAVCDRWRNSFPNFIEDMGRKPSSDHTLDRINNNGNYEPSNCRWATYREQRYNQNSRVHFIEVFGERLPITKAAKKYGIPRQRLSSRIHAGWASEDAVTTKPTPNGHHRYDKDGKHYSTTRPS